MKRKKPNKWGNEFKVPPEVIEIFRPEKPQTVFEKQNILRGEIQRVKDRRDKKAHTEQIKISPKWRLEPKEIKVPLGACLSTKEAVFCRRKGSVTH